MSASNCPTHPKGAMEFEETPKIAVAWREMQRCARERMRRELMR